MNPTNEERAATKNYLIQKFQFRNSNHVDTCIKNCLSQKFFSNFTKRINNLPKNLKTFNHFESDSKNHDWLESDLEIDLTKTVEKKNPTTGK